MRILRETKYEYLYSNYKSKRKNAKFMLLVGIPTSILGIGLASLIANPSPVIWFLVLTGIAIASWGGRELKSSLSYESGIEGERAVVQELQKLDDSYYLINDIMLGETGGNIDHVLICPKGVFAIETKNFSGKIWCSGDYWRKKGARRWYDIPSVSKQAKSNATRLGALFHAQLNLRIFVGAVCVFTNPTVELRLSKPTVIALELHKLAPFLQQTLSSPRLTDYQITAISNCILAECSKYPH